MEIETVEVEVRSSMIDMNIIIIMYLIGSSKVYFFRVKLKSC